MNANELTFGIEFETTMPIGSVEVGAYSRGLQVPWLPAGWVAKGDGSIRSGRTRIGVEFVSPVLRGADGVAQVLAVLAALNARGARVNKSTGLHIHVGGFSMDDPTIERLTTLVANFEQAIYASTGTTARERSSWCHSVQSHGSFAAALPRATAYRYHLLNLTNIRRPEKQTVEFRAFAGTLNAMKVMGYLRMCLGLVERAIKAKRIGSWATKDVAEKSPIRRGGAGATQLTRLFYQLGWTRGRTNYCYGDVTADGAPEPQAIKDELMRLAHQYDERKAQGRP